MPSVVKNYNFTGGNEGFLSLGNAAWISGDGGCFRFFQFRYASASADSAAYGTQLEGLTWEDLGVPVGETVLNVAAEAELKLVKKDGCYQIRFYVNVNNGGQYGNPETSILNDPNVASQPLGTWETASGGEGSIYPPEFSASDQPIALYITVHFQGITPVDAEVHLRSLSFTITYGTPTDPPPDPPTDPGGDPDPEPGGGGPNACSWRVRNIPAGLLEHLQGECLTLAYLVKLARTDGEVFGFTSHDAPLVYDGQTYSPEAGCQITTLRSEAGARVNNLDLQGTLASPFVTDTDLRAGLYDGAELTIYLVNWADITDGALILGRGWMGDVTITDIGWSAEFRSLAQRLQLQVLRTYGPLCDVKAFGDSRCAPGGFFANGDTLADKQHARTVSTVTNSREFALTDAHDSNAFRYGRIWFTTGANAGVGAREIKNHTRQDPEAVLILQEPFPFTVEVGDEAVLEEGCDRRVTTCLFYENVINHRGFPFMAGRDRLRRKGQRN